MSPIQLAIVADDLSGAAECAAHALMRVSRSSVVLHGPPAPGDQVVTLDTDTRGRTGDDAADRVRGAAALVRSAPTIVKKVDSLLRGNISREIAALAAELGRTPVVAVANPPLGRTVRDGVLHVGDTPLHLTDLWRVELAGPPSSVARVLAPLATTVIPQSVVAAGAGAVVGALRDAARAGAVAVCDSSSEHDLSTIHAATLMLPAASLLVGSGALVDVAVQALTPEPALGVLPLPAVGSLLMLLGTRAPSAAAQLARVAGRADRVELIEPTDLLTDPAGVAAHLAHVVSERRRARLVIVTIDPGAAVDSRTSSQLVAAFADVTSPLAEQFAGLFLSGGETARSVLDRLGTSTIRVVGQLATGTVVSHRDGGAVVVTRPGSFGGPDSLLEVARRLLDQPSPDGLGGPTGATAQALGPTAATTSQQPVTPEENP